MEKIDSETIINNITLEAGERLDDLQINNLFLIQKADGYNFNSDSVLLANLVRILPSEKAVDLGTGSGVIAILLAAKTRAKHIYGVEIQKGLYERACRSVKLNNLSERITIINEDMKNTAKVLGTGFDVAVCNPPYDPVPKKGGNGELTETDICRKEHLASLEDVAKSAAKLLKHGGLFYVIVKAKRLAEMVFHLKNAKLEPKEIWPIMPKADREVDTVVILSKKGAKPFMTMNKPIIVFNDDGTYTEEAQKLYGKGGENER